MNSEELKDFEDFYGMTEEKAIQASERSGGWYISELKMYKLNKFIYPLIKQNLYGTVIVRKCWEAGIDVHKNDIYRFKKEYKEKVEYFTNRSIEFRKKVLNAMREREMFHPDFYEYMVDPRTVTREMHSLMPFKEYLFETLEQMENKNE